MKRARTLGIIPARYESTRFPGKPLVKILGKSLIQHTFERTKKSKKLDDIIVATDDKRIFEEVLSFGGKPVMTSPSHPTGTDRLAEVVKNNPEFNSCEIIINVQGDEPVIEEDAIDKVIMALVNDPSASMSTAICPLVDEKEALSPSVVKCVIDAKGRALYFSRSLIPGGKKGFNKDTVYYKHIGLYGYRRDFLLHYADLPQTPLQLAEDLEQLKVLENGYKIHTALINSQSYGVDVPEDIQKIEKYLCQQNLSL